MDIRTKIVSRAGPQDPFGACRDFNIRAVFLLAQNVNRVMLAPMEEVVKLIWRVASGLFRSKASLEASDRDCATELWLSQEKVFGPAKDICQACNAGKVSRAGVGEVG
jgi:hypothetical protein